MSKTAITLTALVELLHDRFEVSKVLVIAPLRVVDSTWPDEVAKWDHLKALKVSKVLGSAKERLAALQAKADIYLINRENVEWLVDTLGKRWPFDMVVIDELSSFKSSKSHRFRALRKVRPLIKRIVGLTGTPAPNGLIDLWSQVYLLDGGERLGKTITGYRDRYFTPGRRNRNTIFTWEPKPEAAEAIYAKISDICVSMTAADWLSVPERVGHEVRVQLTDEARDKYEQLERDLLLPFADGDVVADTAAVLSNKLLQLANGAVYDEHRGVQWVHDAKLDALEDLIEQANGKPVFVNYTYRHDADRIKARFPQGVSLKTKQDIDNWNAGKINLLLAHPASAGHGLNLQKGGNILVWFGLPWSLELYQQAVARLHRQGQTEHVMVYHLVTTGTVDVDVMRALKDKNVTQNALIDAVKARIAEVV